MNPINENPVSDMMKKIATQVEETQEEFIFETVKPYCENIVQMKISKKDLTEALLLWKEAKKILHANNS